MSQDKHTFDTYPPTSLRFERGEGVFLYDHEGTEYLDCAAGIAVSALGHKHPHLVEALKKAADGIWHLSNLFEIPDQLRLADRLCEHTFADRVFFGNSGAEAIECAIKTARRYHYANGRSERVNILTFEGAFHGRTLATIAAGGQAKYLEGFGPKAPGFVSLPFGDEAAVKAAIDQQTAAILIEPIQGEGGIREVPGAFLRFLRAQCDANGILLIYDEIQTGMGRTGKLFAHQWHDAEPDLMAAAKGLGGGFPVGACLAREEVASAMVVGTHGSTFGGNPLAMAIGNAVLDIVLEDGFLEQVKRSAGLFQQILAELADSYPELLEDARGVGLLLGLKCRIANTDLIAAFREHGLLSVGAGDNVVRLVPPLIISEDEIREVRSRMVGALDDIQVKAAS